MWDWKRKLATVAVPAVLGVGATGVIAQAAGPATASAPTTVQPAAPAAPAEAPEPATGTVEASEPSLPGGGHADPPGQVDHQFDGVE
jgi:hypothetical protein